MRSIGNAAILALLSPRVLAVDGANTCPCNVPPVTSIISVAALQRTVTVTDPSSIQTIVQTVYLRDGAKVDPVTVTKLVTEQLAVEPITVFITETEKAKPVNIVQVAPPAQYVTVTVVDQYATAYVTADPVTVTADPITVTADPVLIQQYEYITCTSGIDCTQMSTTEPPTTGCSLGTTTVSVWSTITMEEM